jgi:hypothetical protein
MEHPSVGHRNSDLARGRWLRDVLNDAIPDEEDFSAAERPDVVNALEQDAVFEMRISAHRGRHFSLIVDAISA